MSERRMLEVEVSCPEHQVIETLEIPDSYFLKQDRGGYWGDFTGEISCGDPAGNRTTLSVVIVGSAGGLLVERVTRAQRQPGTGGSTTAKSGQHPAF